MSEGHESEGHERMEPSESGGENENVSDTIDDAATGAEAANPEAGTAPIGGEGQRPEQTQTLAPEDDVGVPEDVEERTE